MKIKGNNYKEVVVEPSGKVHKPQGKNVKMNVPKGSTVYPTYTDFNAELDKMLYNNDILSFKDPYLQQTPIIKVNNSGISASEMDGIMKRNLSKIQVNNVSFNKKGMITYMQKGNSSTNYLNNIGEFKGIDV